MIFYQGYYENLKSLMFNNIEITISLLLIELGLCLLWYISQIIIVAFKLPLASERSVFHTRCCDIDLYFPRWISTLLLKFVDINSIDSIEHSSLVYACIWSDYTKIKLLLSMGADPNIGHPLDLAVLRSDVEMVKLLVQCNATSTMTPYNFEILQLLLNNGHHPDRYIENACLYKDKTKIKLLIDYGVDRNLVQQFTDDPDIIEYMYPITKGALH